MAEHESTSKVDWPKELLDLLQRAGPLASLVLGLALFFIGRSWHSAAVQGSGLGILAVGFLRWASRRPSRLTRKEVFLGVRSVFVGREQEVEQLIDAVKRSSLLWVSGESGSGKSSLLRLGLSPRLSLEREFLPLYIDNWGNDWEAGPVASLAVALRESVESLGGKVNLAARPDASALAASLQQVLPLFNRTPVVILDQFDDYIVDNADRFRPPRGGLVISAAELRQRNGFWREIARLLELGAIRCIVVVRQEQGWGQGAIAFINVREFFVPRCLVAVFDGAYFSDPQKEALWDKFYTGAPQRQRRSVERYTIVKRA